MADTINTVRSGQKSEVPRILKRIDSLRKSNPTPKLRLPDSVNPDLESLGVSSNSRLAYIPQPTDDPEYSFRGGWDNSFCYFMHDGRLALGPSDPMHELLEEQIENAKHHGWTYLTHLDVVASMPRSTRFSRLRESKLAIEQMMNEVHQCPQLFQYRGGAYQLERHERVAQCARYAFTLRLAFYYSRLQGYSVREIEAQLMGMEAVFNPPYEGWMRQELCDLTLSVSFERADLAQWFEDRFNADVELEPVSGHMSIEQYTTSLADTDDDCIVCRTTITPPGVVTSACKHAYCKECLETWTHACLRNSHMCPYCRTEMFPKPQYRPKKAVYAAQYIEYGRKKAQLHEEAKTIDRICKSLRLLEKEVQLQREFEKDVEEREQQALRASEHSVLLDLFLP